jgi:hypothetical protein
MKTISKDDFLPDLKQIRSLFDSHKNEYSEDVLRKQGKEDAEYDIPRTDSDESAPFEVRLEAEVAAVASQVVSKFRAALEMLDAKIKANTDLKTSDSCIRLKQIHPKMALNCLMHTSSFR